MSNAARLNSKPASASKTSSQPSYTPFAAGSPFAGNELIDPRTHLAASNAVSAPAYSPFDNGSGLSAADPFANMTGPTYNVKNAYKGPVSPSFSSSKSASSQPAVAASPSPTHSFSTPSPAASSQNSSSLASSTSSISSLAVANGNGSAPAAHSASIFDPFDPSPSLAGNMSSPFGFDY